MRCVGLANRDRVLWPPLNHFEVDPGGLTGRKASGAASDLETGRGGADSTSDGRAFTPLGPEPGHGRWSPCQSPSDPNAGFALGRVVAAS
jgi:hypothetical protein